MPQTMSEWLAAGAVWFVTSASCLVGFVATLVR